MKENYKMKEYYTVITDQEMDKESQDYMYEEIFKYLFFEKDNVLEIMDNTAFGHFKSEFTLDEFSDFLSLVVQYSLDNNKKTKMMLEYCKYYAKLLDFCNLKSGLFYHCVGLYYTKLNNYEKGRKYFYIAYIDDLKTMSPEEAYNSNAACTIRTEFDNNKYILEKIESIMEARNKHKIFSYSIYTFLDILG